MVDEVGLAVFAASLLGLDSSLISSEENTHIPELMCQWMNSSLLTGAYTPTQILLIFRELLCVFEMR